MPRSRRVAKETGDNMTNSTFVKFRKYSKYHLRNFAVETGLTKGSTNYEKFVVLGVSRSGSNLLRDLLNAHSQVVMFGELFRNDDSLAWDCPVNDRMKSRSRKILSLIRNDPVKLMDTQVFGRAPADVKAVGFKMFYYHAKGENLSAIWPYLKERKYIKIIFLKRRNMLKRYVSLVKAKNTNVWRDGTGKKTEDVKITIDYLECLESFEQVQKWEEEFAAFFRDHECIDVVYEYLAQDNEPETKRIQEFLRLEHQDVKPSIYKQSKKSLAETIRNYSELKRRFEGTPWIEFFDD
jgi:LPS sulfotransferase NodH